MRKSDLFRTYSSRKLCTDVGVQTTFTQINCHKLIFVSDLIIFDTLSQYFNQWIFDLLYIF